MSKYTTEVRWICESKSGFTEEELKNKTVDQIISASRSSIFDFTYPIANEHKAELEIKILKHYYTREIGAETVGLWKLWLNERLNLIMPKYNKLYATETSILNKELKNIDVTEHYTGEEENEKESDYTRTDDFTKTSEESSSFETRNRFSNTPQGSISQVDNNSYLTDYRYVNGSDNAEGEFTDEGTSRNAGSESGSAEKEYTRTETGYRGSKTYMDLIKDYSEKILNIDSMIVYDLKDLFIMLW